MTEEEWARGDEYVIYEEAKENGVQGCVRYLLELAEEQGVDTSGWTHDRMDIAVRKVLTEMFYKPGSG